MKFSKQVILVLFISVSTVSTLLSIDKVWMERHFPNWLPALPTAKKHAYCSVLNGIHLASTSIVDESILTNINFDRLRENAGNGIGDIFEEFEYDALYDSAKQLIGKAYVLTDGTNRYDATLENFGYFIGAYESLPVLKIDAKEYKKNVSKFISYDLLFEKNSSTLSTISPINQFDPGEMTKQINIDSLLNAIKNKLISLEHLYVEKSYLDSSNVTFLQTPFDSLKNEFFIKIEGFDLKGQPNYHGIIYCNINDSVPKYCLIDESYYKKYYFHLRSSMNINGDEYPDYFISDKIAAHIITIRKNKIEYISSFNWGHD